MMVSVKDVGIKYLVGDYKEIGIKEYLMRRAKGKYHSQEFWAVKGISFELEKGDMLGIVGTNGSGKSTLLKAISGILRPTLGTIQTNGKVVALLELASGFDGELTVKENAFLRGAMLGYTRAFMNEKYKEILAFSELSEFEDRPFRNLSSGMQSRLAFSLVSMVQPDILILDEVLAVGDGAFRKKSEKKMMEIIHSGSTNILVSHSTEQVRALCNKVLWIEKGQQRAFGSCEEICDQYEEHLFALGEHMPEFHCNVDLPLEGAQLPASAPFFVSGWAVHRHGVDGVDIHIDGRKIAQAPLHLPRPDVSNAFPDCTQKDIAFQFLVRPDDLETPLSLGQHQLSVTCETQKGTPLTLANRSIFLVDVPEEQEETESPPQENPTWMGALDCPAYGITLSSNRPILIKGWVIDSSPITAIEVQIDGEKIGDANLYCPRPDVEEAFPGIANPTAGFEVTIDPAGSQAVFSPGTHMLTIVAHREEGSLFTIAERKLRLK